MLYANYSMQVTQNKDTKEIIQATKKKRIVSTDETAIA